VEPPSDEEQTRLMKEVIQRELELELGNYMDEPMFDAGTDTLFQSYPIGRYAYFSIQYTVTPKTVPMFHGFAPFGHFSGNLLVKFHE
jgi:hypothetical protein